MALIDKHYICTVETGSDGKNYYHRIGELCKFDSRDGGTFSKLKLYSTPSENISLFRDQNFANNQQNRQAMPNNQNFNQNRSYTNQNDFNDNNNAQNTSDDGLPF